MLLKKPEFGLSSLGEGEVKIEGRLLGLVAVGNQSTDDIDHKVGGAAMPGMLNLRDVLELVNDGFDNAAPAGQ